MDTRELIFTELQRAALAASDEVDKARAELARIPHSEPARRRAQHLKIATLAAEHNRCLSALFSSK